MADVIFKIEEMFVFKDGRTVIVGNWEDRSQNFAFQCTCRLFVNGSLRQELPIQGVEFADRGRLSTPDDPIGLCISESEKVLLDKDEVHTKECYLLIPALPPKTFDDNRPKYKKYIKKAKE